MHALFLNEEFSHSLGTKRAFLEVFFMSALGKKTVKQSAHVGVRLALETNHDLVAYFRQKERATISACMRHRVSSQTDSLQGDGPPRSVPYRGFLLGGGVEHLMSFNPFKRRKNSRS